MKYNQLQVVLLFFISTSLFSQWTINNGNVILNSNGKLGIGTTTPNGKLDIRNLTGISLYSESHGKTPSESAIYARAKLKSVALYGEANFNYGVYGFSFNSNGVVGNFVDKTNNYAGYFMGPVFSTASFVASDRKLKKNIEDLENATDYINSLKPKTYQFDTESYPELNLPKGNHYGLIADELEKLLPTLVRENQSLSLDENSKIVNFKTVNYDELIPILIKGLQEQSIEIQRLNSRLNLIENNKQNSGASRYLISPNPSQSDIKLATINGSPFENSTVIVSNSAGAIVKKFDLIKGDYEKTIDVSNFSSGLYNCSILTSNEQTNLQFIITK